MRVLYRGNPARVRSSVSFLASGCVHGCLLAWVIFAGVDRPQIRPKSMYEQEIRPYEKKIVWYNLRDKLPEIGAPNPPDSRPPRARVKAAQAIVAGTRDDARPAPLVWAPEPAVAPVRTVPLPNVVAVTPPKLVRPFVAPPPKARMEVAAVLPAAPDVAQAKLSLKVPSPIAPVDARLVRPFVAPPAKPRAVVAAVLPAAPEAAPESVAQAALAIVGLNPAVTTQLPVPPASRPAAFSAAPEPRADGGSGAPRDAIVNVPGLVVQGGMKDPQPVLVANFSPTSRENLLAAARLAMAAPKLPVAAGPPRVAPPDPRFAGRVVYSMAIQMPNVTSFSGSWLVWFAEHAPEAGGTPSPMRPPVVVRKVDPKYVAAAVAERVEGSVRLFGVIQTDGHVGGITLLRQLDERLDRTAREALAKWEFAPALRDGAPVEVEAIFEIPFHLAPRPKP